MICEFDRFYFVEALTVETEEPGSRWLIVCSHKAARYDRIS